MKLTLCSIVKNEDAVIRKMLDSVVDVVDEIVIVDTGSTDSTLDIIASFSDKNPGLVHLHHTEWPGDFAATRNQSIDLATGDWILVLDADEYLDTNSKYQIRPFLENTPFDGIFITVRNYTGKADALGSVLDIDVCRVFRSHYRYEGIIHEQIVEPIARNGGKFGLCPVRVHHLGYIEEYKSYKQKSKRNLELLEKQYQAIPRKDKHLRWFSGANLIVEYVMLKQNQQAIDESRPLIEEMKKEKQAPPQLSRMYKLYISALLQAGRIDDALRACKEAVRYFPAYTDFYLTKSTIEAKQGHYLNAITSLKKCKSLGDVQQSTIERLEGVSTYLSDRQLAKCWIELGDDLSARDTYFQAFAENPTAQSVIPMLVLLTQDIDTLSAMRQVIQTKPAMHEFVLHYAIHGFQDALAIIDEALQTYGDSITLRQARFAAEVRHGLIPTMPTQPDLDDVVRHALWQYEQGDINRAISTWSQAGQTGAYFLTILERCDPGKPEKHVSWDMGSILQTLIQTHATNFLSHFLGTAAHTAEVMSMLTHTDLSSVIATDNALALQPQHFFDATWKIQQHILRGQLEEARSLIDSAKTPDGVWSVSGYVLLAELNHREQRKWLDEARKYYPDSKLIAFLRRKLMQNVSGTQVVH